MTRDHAFLGTMDLLRGVPAEVLAGIHPQLRTRSVQAGHTVFREAEAAHAVYLIACGTLRIEKGGVPIATRGHGECVGEYALVDAGVRSASVVALTDATLLEWSHDDAWRALSASDDLRRAVFRVLTRKLREDVSAQVTAAVERGQMLQDLRRAREIQQAMLPLGDLDTMDVVVAGVSRPAAEVGGDYFDAVAEADRGCSLLVADVAGHGLHAALLVAMAKTCFQTHVPLDARPAGVVEALNRAIWLSVRGGMMMTCASVRIDASAGTLSYTNAGHPALLHFRRDHGRIDTLDATDPPLGIELFQHASFHEERTSWRPGDRLLVYTDGVTEARSETGEEFGRERVERGLLECAALPAPAIRDRLSDEVIRFTSGRAQDDDITIVAVEGR